MKLQKRLFALAIACCLIFLCASAWADDLEDEPREVWKNAAYVDGSFRMSEDPQPQEVAILKEGALRTTLDAVQKAQALFADPALGFETTDDSVWAAIPVEGSHLNRADWLVRVTRGEEAASMCLAMDGSGAWNVCMETDPYFAHALIETLDPWENRQTDPCDMDALVQFCLDFAEKMEPGETQYFWSLKYYGCVTDEGAVYALLEAPYTEDHSTSKSFVVAIENDAFRIVDYYSGNG